MEVTTVLKIASLVSQLLLSLDPAASTGVSQPKPKRTLKKRSGSKTGTPVSEHSGS